jgi:hypothetical protein
VNLNTWSATIFVGRDGCVKLIHAVMGMIEVSAHTKCTLPSQSILGTWGHAGWQKSRAAFTICVTTLFRDSPENVLSISPLSSSEDDDGELAPKIGRHEQTVGFGVESHRLGTWVGRHSLKQTKFVLPVLVVNGNASASIRHEH